MFQRIFRPKADKLTSLCIITWNCQMAFRRKAQHVLALQPDIVVVPEAEKPEKWGDIGATSVLWHGENPHKGLAMVSFGPWRLEEVAQRDPAIKYVLPARVTGPWQFNLMGVWTKEGKAGEPSYIGHVGLAADAYHDWFSSGPSMLVGDWNSSAIGLPFGANTYHRSVVDRLSEMGMISAYHSHFHAPHGWERHDTWYNHKWQHRGFHIDYCFIPTAWKQRLRKVHVGELAEWRDHSDHVPLTVLLKG